MSFQKYIRFSCHVHSGLNGGVFSVGLKSQSILFDGKLHGTLTTVTVPFTACAAVSETSPAAIPAIGRTSAAALKATRAVIC